MVNRKIFLEYTRKMSLKKHCLHRVHIYESSKAKTPKMKNFAIGNAEPKTQAKEIAIAKSVPFATHLKEKAFTKKDSEYKKALEGILISELKNEELNNTVAKAISSKTKNVKYVRFYYGVYEIPQKHIYEQGSSSFVTENESGELYPHLICVLSDKENKPLHGFLYPAYRESRYGDKDRYNYF